VSVGLQGAAMHERIYFITHLGKQILVVDVSGSSAVEVERIARVVPDTVTGQPRGSVRLLVDFTGASVDQAALRTIKETAVFDKPYIKASAWIGGDAVSGTFFAELKSFSRREFPVFKTRLEALEWLVKE
jgi:hypothetical protein